MEEQKKSTVTLADEQLDALVQSLLPVMQEFFPRRGARKFGQSILKKLSRAKRMWLDSIPPESHKKSLIHRFKVLTITFECGIIILQNDGKDFDRLYIIMYNKGGS